MSKESLIFSVLGLTVRGFHRNDDKWVPKGGQRLPCALCSGAIDVLKDDQSVGKVATEAPNKFKDWLKADGDIEAVVTGLPKKHRGKKGDEVPVVFVFRSKKNCRMINFKNAITTGISKLKKRKKSLEVVDGDASEEMTFSDTDETQFEFSIRGMTMRGFQVYNEVWVPEIGDRILCSVSGDHSVEMVKDGQTIGHVQTEGQMLFRRFINANGVIHAVVDAEPKQHRSKGEEIPVIYQFSADDWTNKLQNIRNDIRIDIKKRSKKKKCLQFICSEESQDEAGPSSDMQSVDMADGSGENMAGPSSDMRSVEMADGSGENTMESSVTEVINKSHPEGNMEIGAGEKVSYRNNSSEQVEISRKRRSGEKPEASEEKAPMSEELAPKTEKRTQKENLYNTNNVKEDAKQETKKLLQAAPSSEQVVKRSKGKQSGVLKVKTPARSPRLSTVSPKTPLSENRITNYFSPKTTPKAAESVVEDEIFPNPAKKKILQDGKKECCQPIEAGPTSKHTATVTPPSSTEKIPLTDVHFVKFAKYIYGNWESLAVHLDLTNAEVDHIKEDNLRKTELQIRTVLQKWRQDSAEAYLHNFELAMTKCSKDIFQQPELDNYIQSIKDEYRAKQ